MQRVVAVARGGGELPVAVDRDRVAVPFGPTCTHTHERERIYVRMYVRILQLIYEIPPPALKNELCGRFRAKREQRKWV